MQLIPDDCQLCHVLIRDFDACRVERIAYFGLDCQSLFSAWVSNEVYDHGSTFQWTTAPVLADMAEHPMLDLVPFAGARGEMTDMDGHGEFFSQVLNFDFPEAAAVAKTPFGCNQQFIGLRMEFNPHALPPAANSRDGDLGTVMVDPDAYPNPDCASNRKRRKAPPFRVPYRQNRGHSPLQVGPFFATPDLHS
jgi:hypothetical protein